MKYETCAEGMNKMLLRYFFREAEHHSSQRHGILERKNGHLCSRQAREILAVYPITCLSTGMSLP